MSNTPSVPTPFKHRLPALNQALPLLGGLTPEQFMQRYWHKKPFLIRQAFAGIEPPITPQELFKLAARDDVESRLIIRHSSELMSHSDQHHWSLQHGPIAKRALPKLTQPGWTLLVQGLDLHLDQARSLLEEFRFIADARLDDVMISYATDQGGVGPHFDSYDVFLLQVQGTRRWRIGRLAEPVLMPDLPLKILANFAPEQEWLLAPGDMLYLPPKWAHDGIAEGTCMTCSIGFRSPTAAELATELLARIIESEDDVPEVRYRDPSQAPNHTPGQIPPALQRFAAHSVKQLLKDPAVLHQALGTYLSEPKQHVWFAPNAASLQATEKGLKLDRRTRMLYDSEHIYINGESYNASGRDALLMRQLADRRCLSKQAYERASQSTRNLLQQWCTAGWLHAI